MSFEMNWTRRIFFVSALALSGCATAQPGCVSDEQEASLNTGYSRLDTSFFGFRRSLNLTPHGYQVVEAPHPIRDGETADRFEVRPGDCGEDF